MSSLDQFICLTIQCLLYLQIYISDKAKAPRNQKLMINNKFNYKADQVFNQTMIQLDQKKINNFKHLQGQCKIEKVTLLRLNIVKCIFLTLLAIGSVFGLLLLKWYKWLRVKIWFSQCPMHQARYIYIQGSGNDDIQKVTHEKDGGISFYFKNLQYKMRGFDHSPVGMDYEQSFLVFAAEKQLTRGLNDVQVQTYRGQYGKNEHPVQIINYFSYMFQILTKPFFLLQYIVCIAFIVQSLYTFVGLILGFSILTTTINYILLYLSYRKIKQMAEKQVKVKVLRNYQFITVDSNMLVPGDLIDPEGEIMCDCILVKGEIYVNEASLTGESMPIAKFPATKVDQTKEDNRWLFQGSKVLQKRDSVLALVVNTGYTTRRGRIIRKILTRTPAASEVFKSALLFLTQAFIVAMIIFFATIVYMRSRNISTLIVAFRFVNFLGWSFPQTLPIYFNVAYSSAILRLKYNGILCIQPQKTVQASNLKVMCFDKTGTLTENTVQVHQVFRIKDANNISDITDQIQNKQHQLVCKLFSTCHATKRIQGTLMGDQVDLRMFLFSQYDMNQSSNPLVKFETINQKQKTKLQVLRINQFQSKFQSMSVLVRDTSDNTVYAFIKGAPEKIEKNSVLKVQDYEKTVASLSLGGYRTIGFGYRVVSSEQHQKYIDGPREIFQQGITALGLAAFENKLKHDTRQTIDRLVLSGIQPKIITGDNIFIAVETGVRAGIISAQDKVILLQGRKQPHSQFHPGLPRFFKGILLTRHAHGTTQQPITLKQDQNYLNQPYPIAIDNDFLKLEPAPTLTPNIKLFARISPENKALIVMKFKQMIDEQYNKRSFCSRLGGSLKPKVGMCGDGANDLMAIRQSDVGIGINDSDASYGATFTIVNMLDVDYIVRDSKAAITNIIEMIRYYEFISFIKIPASLLMVLDTSYFNQAQLLFFNFTSTSIYPFFMARSTPSKNVTKAIPNGNFFGPVNQFRFWGSVIIATGGLVAGYMYYVQTPEFVPNQTPIAIRAWAPLTRSATCMFLLIQCPMTIYALFFYISHPWKQKIYKNIPLFLLIILNFISTVALHYITSIATPFLATLPISNGVVSILLLISIAACGLGYLYNYAITEIVNQYGINRDEEKGKYAVGNGDGKGEGWG